jgi:hypothetical protein
VQRGRRHRRVQRLVGRPRLRADRHPRSQGLR